MFRTIEDFEKAWRSQSENTLKIMASLTDDSLNQAVASDYRTLGRLAWHIAQSIPEMGNRAGLTVSGPEEHDRVPKTAAEIRKKYQEAADSIFKEIKGKWNDKSLLVEDDMYGEKWKRGKTLRVLIDHEIHHRGQMTVLLRQAGCKVPGIYGPSKEEWANYGMKPPEI